MSGPLFIGPYDIGVERDLKPFMIPEKAWSSLTNGYVFRGRVHKKSGSSLLGRLRRCPAAFNLNLQANGGTYSANLYTDVGYVDADSGVATIVANDPNGRIQPGSLSITVGAYTFADSNADGVILQTAGPGYVTAITNITQAANALVTAAGHNYVATETVYISGVTGMTQINNAYYGVIAPVTANDFTLNVNSTAFSAYAGAGTVRRVAGSINYETGALTLNFVPALGAPTSVTVTLCYFPGRPVMGLEFREQSTLSLEQTVAFDTRYAYQYNSVTAAWEEFPSTLPTIWSGSDSQFFWSHNYERNSANSDIFWVTNGKSGLHAYQVTTIGGAAAGPPSTANITTSTANNFQVGDTVVFINMSGGVANKTLCTVTGAGNPFAVVTVDATLAAAFTNGAFTGLVISSRSIGQNVANQDGVRFYASGAWSNLNAAINGTTVTTGALLIVAYKNRLVLLNTIEGNNSTTTSYTNRARWSQNGNPLDFVIGWRDDIIGRGGFVDASTNEQIVTAGFVKDQLIVYFERSVWQLVYTGNEILPFTWQRINSELGAESSYSVVPFDNGLVAMSSVGVHTTNGVSVERIDSIIPDTVFTILNANDGPKRVEGIRDYYKELAYFTYPDLSKNTSGQGQAKFPDKVLVFNYKNGTYSFFNESYTTYGYFQRTNTVTWATLPYSTWSSWNDPWNSGTNQSQFLNICAGNQQGYVFLLEPQILSNPDSLWIQGLSGTTVTSLAHNLQNGQYVRIAGCLGSTNLNNQIFRVITTPTADTFTISTAATGTYTGGGQIKVLSSLKWTTKMFNPFWAVGRNFRLKYIEFLFDHTDQGQVTSNIFLNTDTSTSVSDESLWSSLLGTNTVSTAPEPDKPYQFLQNVIWHRMYTYVEGETFQIQLELDDAQMTTLILNESDVVLHGMILHFEPAGQFP